MISLSWGCATDVGLVRDSNQDSLLMASPLFAVADGMGGHLGGEVASATALEILGSAFEGNDSVSTLMEAVRRANARVWDKAQLDENLRGMGTTLTAAAKVRDEESGEERLAVINVGDSRTYRLHDNDLEQITHDHSFVEEMIRAGEISPDEAETHPKRNIVTRALGVEPTVEADLVQIDLVPGDRILLCSDGLTREVGDDQIAAVLRRLKHPDEAARELVNMAKANGGHDNITIVIVDVEDRGSDPNPTGQVPKTKAKTKKEPKAKKPKHTKPVEKKRTFTMRMALFIILVMGLIGAGFGGALWYARGTYYVGLEGEQLVIYRGRPQPVLGFKPTVTERTNVRTADVLPSALPQLQAGATTESFDAAQRYIQNLTSEAAAAKAAADPAPVTTVAPPPRQQRSTR